MLRVSVGRPQVSDLDQRSRPTNSAVAVLYMDLDLQLQLLPRLGVVTGLRGRYK